MLNQLKNYEVSFYVKAKYRITNKLFVKKVMLYLPEEI